MKTGITWLDGMHKHASDLESIAAQIRELSRAFERTGNESVGVELWTLAQDIKTQADTARELTANKVNGDYREAVQSSANVLSAVLAGTKLGQAPKDA